MDLISNGGQPRNTGLYMTEYKREETRTTYDGEGRITGYVKTVSITVLPSSGDEGSPSNAAKAEEFLATYFNTAETNPSGLRQFYRSDSQLTFQGVQTHGAAEIANRLNSHPLNQCRYAIREVDYQPSTGTGGMLASITGHIQIFSEERAYRFSRVFHLMPTPEGSCYAQNDILRVDSA